jgi:hypothetical protein
MSHFATLLKINPNSHTAGGCEGGCGLSLDEGCQRELTREDEGAGRIHAIASGGKGRGSHRVGRGE